MSLGAIGLGAGLTAGLGVVAVVEAGTTGLGLSAISGIVPASTPVPVAVVLGVVIGCVGSVVVMGWVGSGVVGAVWSGVVMV